MSHQEKLTSIIITFVIILAYILAYSFKAIRLILLMILATPFLLICYLLDSKQTLLLLKELKRLEFDNKEATGEIVSCYKCSARMYEECFDPRLNICDDCKGVGDE